MPAPQSRASAPHSRRPLRVGPFLAFAVCAALVAGLTATAGASRVPARAAVAATQMVRVIPVTAHDRLKPGYSIASRLHNGMCEPGSDVLAGVYRCFAGNFVVDPCWPDESSSTPAVDCVLDPWKHQVVRITLRSRLTASPGGPLVPWGLQLSTGQRCVAAQGTHSGIDNNRHILNYDCSPKLALVDQPNRSATVWTIREAISRGGNEVLGPTVAIAKVYYGLPSHL